MQDPDGVAKLKSQLDEAMALIAKLQVSNQTPSVATPPPGGIPTPSPPASTSGRAPSSKSTTPLSKSTAPAPKVAAKRAAAPPQQACPYYLSFRYWCVYP